jgi:hypothetical protein
LYQECKIDGTAMTYENDLPEPHGQFEPSSSYCTGHAYGTGRETLHDLAIQNAAHDRTLVDALRYFILSGGDRPEGGFDWNGMVADLASRYGISHEGVSEAFYICEAAIEEELQSGE